MVNRAKRWLLSRRDGRGGFLSKNGYNHGWGNSEAVSNAYITYALAYVGVRDIQKELNTVTQEAKVSQDLYRLALATLAHFELGEQSKGEDLLAFLNQASAKQSLTNISA